MSSLGPENNAAVSTTRERRAPEKVHFARTAGVDYTQSKAFCQHRSLLWRMAGVGFAALILLSFDALAGLLGNPSRGIWGLIFVLALVVLILLPVAIVSRARYRRKSSQLPHSPPVDARLSCAGLLEDLAEYGEWADVPFEPALFYGRFVIGNRSVSKWFYASIFCASLLVGCLITKYGLGMDFGRLGYTKLCAAFLLAEGLTALLWPTYLRLVPGRLDVLGYSPFSRTPLFFDSYDLHAMKITADLRNSFVSIQSAGGGIDLGISLMRERRRFVYMLFLAAMSSYSPSPVPADRLLG
jgi:hypothetical protein